MRLIDADKLEKEMNELCCGECECCALEKCPAYSQPTAYDGDGVVEKLRNLYSSFNPYDSYWDEGAYRATEFENETINRIVSKAIKIVEAGRINEGETS